MEQGATLVRTSNNQGKQLASEDYEHNPDNQATLPKLHKPERNMSSNACCHQTVLLLQAAFAPNKTENSGRKKSTASKGSLFNKGSPKGDLSGVYAHNAGTTASRQGVREDSARCPWFGGLAPNTCLKLH
eukprot:20574-Amphidinium_carterae.1